MTCKPISDCYLDTKDYLTHISHLLINYFNEQKWSAAMFCTRDKHHREHLFPILGFAIQETDSSHFLLLCNNTNDNYKVYEHKKGLKVNSQSFKHLLECVKWHSNSSASLIHLIISIALEHWYIMLTHMYL